MLPPSKTCSAIDSHPSVTRLPCCCKYSSPPHQLPCPSLLSSDPKIKYPCLWHNRLVLKLSSLEASVIISGLPACNQQGAGDRMPVAVTASGQPNAPGSAMQSRPEAAARVCCRMLTEEGKIHLQSELVPCFCFACFLAHPRIPSALTPLTASGQAGCPWGGLSERGHFDTPPKVLPGAAPQDTTAWGRDQLTPAHPSRLPPRDLQWPQDKWATGQRAHG